MYRCAGAAIAAALLCVGAQAQTLARNFPATALRGSLELVAPPDVRIDGKPARLAAGVRIRDTDNLIKLPGTLTGRKLLVHYTTDLQGEVLDAWILRPDEAAKKPWPKTAAEAQAWSFDPVAQTWIKP